MWRDITLANGAHLLTEMDAYLEELKNMRDLVEKADGPELGEKNLYANAPESQNEAG